MKEQLRQLAIKLLIKLLLKLNGNDQMSLINTVTGVAEGLLGNVGDWRKVVQNNPSELFGKLPPTLQTDLDRYYKTIQAVGDKLNIKGLDTPTGKEVSLTLDTVLKGSNLSQVTNRLNAVGIQAENAQGLLKDKGTQDLLKQIDWLL